MVAPEEIVVQIVDRLGGVQAFIAVSPVGNFDDKPAKLHQGAVRVVASVPLVQSCAHKL